MPPPPEGTVGARELANIAHGVVVCLGLPGDGHRPATALFDALARAAMAVVDEFNPQELSNLVWAFAKATHRAYELFEAVAVRASAIIKHGTSEWLPSVAIRSLVAATNDGQGSNTDNKTTLDDGIMKIRNEPSKLELEYNASLPPDAAVPALYGSAEWASARLAASGAAGAEGPLVSALDMSNAGRDPAGSGSSSSNTSTAPQEVVKEEEEEEEEEEAEEASVKEEPVDHAPPAPLLEDGGDPLGGDGPVGALGEFEGLPTFTPQESTNVLYAYARSAHDSAASRAVFAALASSVSESWQKRHAVLISWSAQDLCNAMWSCASVDVYNAEIDDLISACVHCLRRTCFKLERPHLTQLQQWSIWWEVEMGRSASWMDASLRQRCKKALASGDVQVDGGHTTSSLQREVGRAMHRLRVPFTDEFITGEGYSIDLVVEEKRIAIEVDGPHHFTQQMTETGATKLKQRQLTALGWTCVQVTYKDWPRSHSGAGGDYQGTIMLQEQLLRKLLPEGTVPEQGEALPLRTPQWAALPTPPAAPASAGALGGGGLFGGGMGGGGMGGSCGVSGMGGLLAPPAAFGVPGCGVGAFGAPMGPPKTTNPGASGSGGQLRLRGPRRAAHHLLPGGQARLGKRTSGGPFHSSKKFKY